MRNRALWKVFLGGQVIGLDLLPRHFYSGIPDIRALRSSDHWRGPQTLSGVSGADLEAQQRTLDSWFPEKVLAALAEQDVYQQACTDNGAHGYGPTEASLLFAFIASQRPSRVVQVGAGVSTSIILQARAAFDVDVDVVCVEPFPTPFLCRAARRGEIRLIQRPAQAVSVAEMAGLTAGDLFFVDSTHTVKAGSEVNYIILEVLPRLPAGTLAHFHDILFPYDYPPDLMDGCLFFWNESTLLHAFLIGNDRVGIELSSSMLHHDRPDALCQVLPRYSPAPMRNGLRLAPQGAQDFPSATYLRVRDA